MRGEAPVHLLLQLVDEDCAEAGREAGAEAAAHGQRVDEGLDKEQTNVKAYFT